MCSSLYKNIEENKNQKYSIQSYVLKSRNIKKALKNEYSRSDKKVFVLGSFSVLLLSSIHPIIATALPKESGKPINNRASGQPRLAKNLKVFKEWYD